MTQNFKMKAKAFIGLANCCKILKMFDNAIRILRKALEYGKYFYYNYRSAFISVVYLE